MYVELDITNDDYLYTLRHALLVAISNDISTIYLREIFCVKQEVLDLISFYDLNVAFISNPDKLFIMNNNIDAVVSRQTELLTNTASMSFERPHDTISFKEGVTKLLKRKRHR